MTPDALAAPHRLAALRDSGLLDGEPDPALDRITRLAARLLDARIAYVSAVADDRQRFAGSHGLPDGTPGQLPLPYSICRHVVRQDAPLIVGDTATHELLRHDLAVRDLGVAAYAGVPLRAGGATVGALCAVDTAPRVWSDEHVALLHDIAAVIADQVELRAALRRGPGRDGLTGMLDAGAVAADIDARLSGAEPATVGVYAIGVDDLDAVNGAASFGTGDEVLRDVARRIERCLPDAAIGRVSGDVFVAVRTLATGQDPLAIAQALRAAVGDAPYRLQEAPQALHGRVAVVTCASGDAEGGGAALVDRACASLARARALGALDGGWTREALQGRAVARAGVRALLDRPGLSEELHVAYEPLPGAHGAHRAVLRWDSPELGPVPRAIFVPVAERSGAALAMGEWLLARAARDVATGRTARFLPAAAAVVVPLFAAQLSQPGLDILVAATLEGAGLAPSDLVLELPAGLDPEAHRHAVEALEARGLRLTGAEVA